MTSSCQLPACSRPPGSAFVCRTHGRELGHALAEVEEWIAEDLRLVLGRQVRYGSGGSRSGSSRPLVYDDRASRVITRLMGALDAAVRAVQATGGATGPGKGVEATAGWLRARVTKLRHVDGAGDLVTGILGAYYAALAVADRPADRWFAGPCNNDVPVDRDDSDGELRECGVDLYARAGAATVECRRCGAEYDVQARRDWLLAAAEDELLEAAAVARAVSWLGEQPLTAERIRKWKERGQLVPVARRRCPSCMVRPVVRPCPMCRPLYRVGDVIDALAARSSRRTAIA